VLVFGACELGTATQLRAAGEAAREIRCLAGSKGCEDVATADLIAEEMRRSRDDGRVGWFRRHPVDAGEMEAADAAGLVAARAAHVVQPALEAADGPNILQRRSLLRGLRKYGDDVALAEQRIAGAVLTGDEAKGRLHFRRRETGRCRRDRTLEQEAIRNHDRAAIELGEMDGIEQPR